MVNNPFFSLCFSQIRKQNAGSRPKIAQIMMSQAANDAPNIAISSATAIPIIIRIMLPIKDYAAQDLIEF
jgi:hypothetical protein